MKKLKLLALIFLTQSAFAQIKVTKLSKNDIPVSIKYIGHIVDAVKYADSDGEYLVFTTETGAINAKDKSCPECRSADIYAYNYKIDVTQYKLIWRVHDFVTDCIDHIITNYCANTFAVTDLNNDGKAEVWLMYQLLCSGDVSPATMKIIMYENGKKYALRGTSRAQVTDTQRLGGTYTFDFAFKTGPKAFREYAEQLWRKHIDDNF